MLVATASVLAGCSSFGSTPTDTPTETPSVPTETPHTDPDTDTPEPLDDTEEPGCPDGLELAAVPFDAVDDLPVALDDESRPLVREAAADGAATLTTYRGRPLRGGVYVRFDGAFYRTELSSSSETVPAYLLDATWEAGRTPAADDTAVAYADLPAVDRRAFRLALRLDEREQFPRESAGVSDYPAPYPEGGDDSLFLEEWTLWVRYDDRTFRVTMGERTTTERETFRYEVTRVAADAAGFRAAVRERYRVDLPADDRQREILRAAAGDGYEECAPLSDALEAIHERLEAADRLPFPVAGWYVTVDGDPYRVETYRGVE